MKPRRTLLTIAAAAALVGGWSVWRWASAPQAPDVRTADLGTVIGFMGSQDYSQISQGARSDYARGVSDRFAAALLEKFYARPESQRTFILRAIARAQLTHAADECETPEEYRLRLHHQMTSQTPRVQAMYVQFALDLHHQREDLR